MSAVAGGPFVHPALFYRGADEYVAGVVPFLQAGLAGGYPVAAAVPGHNLALLRDALGEDGSRVQLLDMSDAGRNPGRIIPGVLRAVADAHPTGDVRIVGEPIWPGRTEDEYPACAQHEALINLAFAGRRVTILCPYDAARLDPQVLADAAMTHPVLIDADGERESERYAPERIINAYNLPLLAPGPTECATALLFNEANLKHARGYAAAHARRLGLSAGRVYDLELAVSELATNSVIHGGGRGTLRVWAVDGHLVCEIRDTGAIDDPLVGRRPATVEAPTGRGLLLVNQLADLVRIHTTKDGTTIRLHMVLSRAPRP